MVSRPAGPEDGSQVAALTTLAGWRQFASEMPAVPELLDIATWKGLDADKRAAYDDDRIAHHSRLLVVQTPAVRDVVTTGRRLAHMNRAAPYGRSGLIVSGPARTGKTTAITQLGKTIEVFHRRRHPGCGADIPVVYITVPPAATPRMIAAEFARFLGIPVTRQANITDIIDAVCGVCTDTRTTAICVDEIHNLSIATRSGAEASDTLKYFSERIPATFVLAGINVERVGLLSGPRGEQIAGRPRTDKPGDRAQPPRHGGSRPAPGFQVTCKALDLRAASIEQADMLLAPAGILAQVQRVRVAGQAGVPGQEPS
jgi:AAA domain